MGTGNRSRAKGGGLTRSLMVVSLVLACQIVLGGLIGQAQADESFVANVDRTRVATGDLVTLDLVLRGTFRAAGRPDLPPLPGFAVVSSSQSSQFSMANGGVSSQVTFSYRLQAIEAGTHTIPAVSMQVGGRTLTSDPLTVEVTQGQAQVPGSPMPAPADAQAPAGVSAQAIFVQAEVDQREPYVGQQTIYTFRLYQAIELYNQPRLDLPEFDGFLVYDLAPNRQYVQEVKGRQYQVTEVRRALFGLSPGQVVLDAALLEIPGDLFNRGVSLKTEPVIVEVRALPPGAPEGFSGAVGQFQIEAWADPNVTRTDEPVTLTVRVAGQGNLDMIPDPVESESDALDQEWRVYDAQVGTEVRQDGDQIAGERVFERPMLARAEGALAIPALALPYFDPDAGAYRMAVSEPILVLVEASAASADTALVLGQNKQDVRLVSSDIRHIKQAPPSLRAGRASLYAQPAYWAGWVAAPVGVLGVWMWDRQKKRRASDSAAERAQRAQRRAKARMREARQCLREGHETECYAQVARGLLDYVADKANLASAGLTRDTISSTLERLGARPRTISRLLACLERADSGRFAPSRAVAHGNSLIEEAELVVQDIEMTLAG